MTDAADMQSSHDDALTYLELATAAGRGDLSAIRTIADTAIDNFNAGNGLALGEAMLFARLATAQGDVSDWGRMISLLAVATQVAQNAGEGLSDVAAIHRAEMVARMEVLSELAADKIAEVGAADYVAVYLPNAIAEMGPREAKLTRDIRKTLMACGPYAFENPLVH